MKTILIIAMLLLTGCGETPDRCRWDVPNDKQEKQAELFDRCLMRVAEARKGVSYTTNDDEDYDEVIEECYRATRLILTVRICEKKVYKKEK